MSQQTSLDLRARFARTAAKAREEETTQAAPRKGEISQGRIDLLRTMLHERYEADEAERRFAQFDWAEMTYVQFREFFDFLKRTPKLPSQAGAGRISGSVPLIVGRFTVVLDDKGTYRTIRILRKPKNSGFMPGRMVLGYLNGPDNSNDYLSFGHVDEKTGEVVIWKRHQGNAELAEAVKVLVGDPKAAAQAYFERTGNCTACGQVISRPDSLENAKTNGGLGPDCEDKASW